MTKEKRNKAKFWCHRCALVGFRNPADAAAKAAEVRLTVLECPAGYGWHVK